MYCAENCSCTLCRELCCVKQTPSKNRPPVTVPKPKFIQMMRMSNKCAVVDDDDKDNQTFNLMLKRRSSDGFDKQYHKSSVIIASESVTNQAEPEQQSAAAPLTKSMSCNEIRKQFESRSIAVAAAANHERHPTTKLTNANHRTVIYFGDSISNKKQISRPVQYHRISTAAVARNKIVSDVQHANRLCDEMVFKRQQSIRLPAMPPPMKIELRSLKVTAAVANADRTNVQNNGTTPTNIKRLKKVNESAEITRTDGSANIENLPHFVESIANGVINIKIDGSYNVASKLVQKIENDDDDGGAGDGGGNIDTTGNNFRLDESGRHVSVGDINAGYYDWSFVQDWRSRPSENGRDGKVTETRQHHAGNKSPTALSLATDSSAANDSNVNKRNGNANCMPSVASDRIVGSNSSEIEVAIVRASKNVAETTHSWTISNSTLHTSPKSVDTIGGGISNATTCQINSNTTTINGIVINRDVAKLHQSSAAESTKLIIQNAPNEFQSADTHNKRINVIAISSATESNQIKAPAMDSICSSAMQQRRQECHSSSDENRSSGHASMSDTGNGSSSPGCGDNNRGKSTMLEPSQQNRLACRPGTNLPIEQIHELTIHSPGTSSTYSSLSAESESSVPAQNLDRYASLETVNTNVTTADEFVWIDSHNRLVELQHPPWIQQCILRVIRRGRCHEQTERISPEIIPRLSYLLQRALVRVAREIQRLSTGLGLCSRHEVAGAFKIVLCPALADSCIKACLRAAAMFSVPGESALRQSKSVRAGLLMSISRMHRWMSDTRLGRFVHEYAAIYLCAGLENLLEEIVMQCISSGCNDAVHTFTTADLEHALAGNSNLWGLLQPYAHLNAGRIASGALTMPRWTSQTSMSTANVSIPFNSSVLEPCLLATCVGSVIELKELILRAQSKFNYTALSHAGLTALFHFMRCSQLEHNGDGANSKSTDGDTVTNNGSAATPNNLQELCNERAYVVLPPLVEWLRVSSAHAEYRHSILIDSNDIMQAARLLLPGVDCPPRPIGAEDELPSKNSATYQMHPSIVSNPNVNNINDTEYGRRATITFAFRLMLTGRLELLKQANALLPSASRYDTLNQAGLTAVMIAAIRNDEAVLKTLLDAGANPNIEVPSLGLTNACTNAIHPETQHWTAVTFAACRGNYAAVRMLLKRGACVEGGASLADDRCTLTPLQVSSASGAIDIVELLLSYGANAFLSTQHSDSMCFSATAQRGCYSAISVAAAHNQRPLFRKLLSHPLSKVSRDVLSLEEMLAEGDNCGTRNGMEMQPTLTKTQIKCLQEAMYHSAENNHLDITIELRALGVPWTLHSWMQSLAAAHEIQLDSVIEQILQEFSHVCPNDYSSQFVTECLPLLFSIFRHSKKEVTKLLLADIFATSFGREDITPIKEPIQQTISGSRIDLKFVNNPELSDVMFRVDDKIIYGHKIVLITASPRFKNMFTTAMNDDNTPTIQINDIRYHIFQLVMQYLYSGGCQSLHVIAPDDVLELMAAASFFQLDELLRYTEARCSQIIDIDNIVSTYIHARVYGASKLLEFCQGFLLKNMVELLTYSDVVKRLLFAKKIPNHDVLNGLLATLQYRIQFNQ